MGFLCFPLAFKQKGNCLELEQFFIKIKPFSVFVFNGHKALGRRCLRRRNNADLLSNIIVHLLPFSLPYLLKQKI